MDVVRATLAAAMENLTDPGVFCAEASRAAFSRNRGEEYECAMEDWVERVGVLADAALRAATLRAAIFGITMVINFQTRGGCIQNYVGSFGSTYLEPEVGGS